jgi:hypothetical protein
MTHPRIVQRHVASTVSSTTPPHALHRPETLPVGLYTSDSRRAEGLASESQRHCQNHNDGHRNQDKHNRSSKMASSVLRIMVLPVAVRIVCRTRSIRRSCWSVDHIRTECRIPLLRGAERSGSSAESVGRVHLLRRYLSRASFRCLASLPRFRGHPARDQVAHCRPLDPG